MTQHGFNQYRYDPEWRRLKKVTATSTRYYLWDSERLIAEYDTTGNRKARYAYIPGDYSPTEVEINNIVYQVRTDHLGTPLELINAQNNVVWRAHYEAFGKAVINDDVDGDGTPVRFNVRMPGQYYDVESEWHYNWHRYYDPATGRYVTSDPIGLMGGVNTYAYVGNKPLIFVDPYGLIKLPNDPSGLPSDWQQDPTHQDPNGSRWRNPNGDQLDFHQGRPMSPGQKKPNWKNKDHWHHNDGDEHLPPGSECPVKGETPESSGTPESESPSEFSAPQPPWWILLPVFVDSWVIFN